MSVDQDEEAIICGLSRMGVEIKEKNLDDIKIEVLKKNYDFKNTKLGIEFNSDNKYMMKVVKSGENKYHVYTKGAIETLLPLLDKSTLPDNYEDPLEVFFTECISLLEIFK